MYYTAPGHSHVQLLVPPTGRVPARPLLGLGGAPPATERAPNPPPELAPVVQEALNAALSKHRSTSMMTTRFAPAVRAHIRARQRAATLTTARKTGPHAIRNAPAAGKVKVLTYHAREGGEFFGTVEATDGTRRAYAAKIQDGKLVSFKVL